MASGGVPIAMFRGVNPVYVAAQVAAASPRRIAKVPFKVSFSSYPGRDDGAVRPRSARTTTRSSRGATRSPCAARCRCSSRQWIACSTRAPRPTCSSASTKGDPATAGRYPVRRLSDWLIGRFPGGAQAFGAALARGMAPGSPLRARRAPRTVAAGAGRGAARGTAGRLLLRRLSVARARRRARRRTSRGCRSSLIPSRKIAWQSWIEIHPTTAARLGIENGDHLTVETAAGSVTAPAYIYPRR